MVTCDAADESHLGLDSVEASATRPPHSNHLLDEAPLTEHCPYELDTSESWIAICDASTADSVESRVSM